MRHVDTIMVHCSATHTGWMADASVEEQRDEITRWHVEDRGWLGNGYAWIIGRNGDEAIGRDLDNDGDPWEHVTAGARGHNKRTIHLCLIGGAASSENDQFEDHFTHEQAVALRKRIAELRRKFPSIKKVIGHNEVAAKACPGFKVGPWLNRKAPRGLSQSKTMTGGTGAAIGTTGSVAAGELAKLGADAQGAASKLQPLIQHAEAIQWAFVALTLIGVSLVMLSRWKDWKRGRR